MTEILPRGYSSESYQKELSNEFQHDQVLDGFQIIFASLRFLTIVALALETLISKVRVIG